ncbi:hypothetical protein M3573_19410 [Bacillus safensis]|uniref:hypothetical protein n=1 Tax=Bacillus safensis TaxID=561879 RepID=UPI002040FCF0|nr:hypothetical protein [Bacillus safensis]MCM3140449.1 hypothetical protein [Bacillus safensis]
MAALKGVKTLDMVDGEITKVAYEGSEYERVEGQAEVGDLLSVTEGIYHEDVGEFFECYDVDCDGDAVFDVGVCRGVALERSTYALFRKKHTRLKVGDYAKVVGTEDLDGIDEGDIVWVFDDAEDDVPYLISPIVKRRKALWVPEETLVPATDAEITAAKEAKAQRTTQWASIGRKVGEYKVGDIVAYDDPHWFQNKGVGEVVEDTDIDGDTQIEAVDHRGDREGNYLAPEKLTLITPVEARFDRS